MRHLLVLAALLLFVFGLTGLGKARQAEAVLDTPTFRFAIPTGPANNNHPQVFGDSNSPTVEIWDNATCTGTPLVTGTSTQFSYELSHAQGLTITVPDDSTTILHATGFDPVSNTRSSCSTSTLFYIEDSFSAPPTLTGTLPASPADNNLPSILGTAENGASVAVFGTADCSGSPLGQGTASATTGAFTVGLTVPVPNNQTAVFHATGTDTAGNASTCSTSSVAYVEQTLSLQVPALSSSPASPSNQNTPSITGVADPGSTSAALFINDCTGASAGTGPITAGQFSIPVTVGENTTTVFRATVSDGTATSACSAPFTYVEDSTPPTIVITGSNPPSPSPNGNPSFFGTVSEPFSGSVFLLQNTCSGPTLGYVGDFLTSGVSILGGVPLNSTTVVVAVANDLAGNRGCSAPFTYVASSGTSEPSLTSTSPVSPANNNSPKVIGTAPAGSTVNIYTTATCSGSPVATGTATSLASSGITVPVADNSTTSFRATASGIGGTSACSSPLTYVEDSQAPAAPVIGATAPVSPSNNNLPKLIGAAEAGSTVRIFTTSDCSGAPVATGTAASFASPGLTVSVAANTTTAFRATATDAAGNISSCSTARTYIEDSTAPVLSPMADLVVESKAAPIAVTFTNPAAKDGVDGAVKSTCSPPSGSSFPFGKTGVKCTATDRAGNVGGEVFVVVVQLPTTAGAVNNTDGMALTQVYAHEKVIVTAGGFLSGQKVELKWLGADGSVIDLADDKVDAQGRFSKLLHLPQDLLLGPGQVIAIGQGANDQPFERAWLLTVIPEPKR